MTTRKNSVRWSYWREAVMDSLEHAGLSIIASDCQIDTLTECIMGWRDCEGDAFGDHSIPNPERVQAEENERKYKKRIEELEADVRKTNDQAVKAWARAVGKSGYADRYFLNEDGYIEEKR